MGFSYNHGMVTPMKGAVLHAARITGLNVANGSDCTIDEQLGAGFIDSVEHDAAGVYIVKLAAPWPPKVVIALAEIVHPTNTTDLLHARADAAGYDSATGWLTINVSNDDDSGAPVAADGGATDELHLLMVFGRYTTI